MTLDPASILAKGAASVAPAAAKRALRMWRLRGTSDLGWVSLRDTSLSPQAHRDIKAFLDSENVRTLVVAISLLRVTGDFSNEALLTLERAFIDQATIWCADRPSSRWSESADEVFEQVLTRLEATLEVVSATALDQEVEVGFGNLLEPRLGTPKRSSDLDAYAKRLVELVSDFDRADAALRLSVAAAENLASRTLPPIISHTETDQRADFGTLYVPRSLIHEESKTVVHSVEESLSGLPFRIVLRGNPGAGKSTFVRHLATALARVGDGAPVEQASIILKCRDFDPAQSLVDQLATSLRLEGITESRLDVLEDALLLGQFVIIFDGLDEIADVERRTAFVGRVEAFSARYLTTSILVTSRVLGYERTGFARSRFEHFRLEEFSEAQVREYAEKWFAARGRDTLVEPFLSESQSVSDLRRNPLLLSLLCILFGARGTIPRRRREIYFKCADLLFFTWDSHRQIGQPEELPAYGNRLMQQIARWVYGSQAAQNGLEERQIIKVISNYLESVGVEEEDARLRAAEFLDFCAGRAWLLGSFGRNDYDERIFTFTHRTFYEYFAAEAFCREAGSSEDVARRMLEAFQRDSTSVLPELLIQAWDEKEERGASEVFRLICQSTASAGLILRLMNGSLLPKRDRSLGFEKVIAVSDESKQMLDRDATEALFSLNRTALHHLRDEWLMESSSRGRDSLAAAVMFANAYANYELAERTHTLPDYVHELADVILARFDDSTVEVPPVLYQSLMLRGKRTFLSPGRAPWSPLGVVTCFGSRCGAIPRSIALQARQESESHHDELVRAWLQWFSGKQQRVPDRWLRIVSQVRDEDMGSCGLLLAPETWPREVAESETYTAAVLIALSAVESFRPGSWVLMSGRDGGGVADLLVVRRHSLRDGPEPSVTEHDDAAVFCTDMPSWVDRWRKGEFVITRESSDDFLIR